MPYTAAKTRASFQEMCASLARKGFRISHLSQYNIGADLYLELVILNEGNLGLNVRGKVGPPYWGEDLFYKILGQVSAFGQMCGR